MLQRIQGALRKNRLLEPGQRVGVAVSGGADSIALLHVLCGLADEWRFQLVVLHVNYKTRGTESDGDEQFVRATAEALGLSVLVDCPVLPAGNFEQAAREARYAWFRELVAAGVCERVTVGHTRSDQAETVLFRFLRGSGGAGLAAIRPMLTGGIVRPLLNVTAEETRCWLVSRGLNWREDSSNADPERSRNRIRRELLPMLSREWNPALPEILARTADWAQAEEDYWDGEVRRLAGQCLILEHGCAIFSAAKVSGLPLAAARRLVRFAICHVKGHLHQVDFPHIERTLELAARLEGGGRLSLPGVIARRSFDWVRLAEFEPETKKYRQILKVPGEFPVFAGHWVLQLELKTTDSVYNVSGHQLDWGLVSGSLELRNWRPGDHYIPAGHTGEIKLKQLFQEARIPFWDRQQWPVIAQGDAIVWTRRFGPAAGLAPAAGASSVLVIREIPCGFSERANQNASV